MCGETFFSSYEIWYLFDPTVSNSAIFKKMRYDFITNYKVTYKHTHIYFAFAFYTVKDILLT